VVRFFGRSVFRGFDGNSVIGWRARRKGAVLVRGHLRPDGLRFGVSAGGRRHTANGIRQTADGGMATKRRKRRDGKGGAGKWGGRRQTAYGIRHTEGWPRRGAKGGMGIGDSVLRWFGLAPGSTLPAPCSRSGRAADGIRHEAYGGRRDGGGGAEFSNTSLSLAHPCGLDSGWEEGSIT